MPLSLDAPSQIGSPGSLIQFTGLIGNDSGAEVFFNGAGGELSSAELTLDLSPFFFLVPLSLPDGGSYSGEIFAVAISAVAAPGDYFGTIVIQGGADSLSFDEIAVQSFQVTVTTSIPEPALFTFVSMLIMFAWRFRACLQSGRAGRKPQHSNCALSDN